VKPNLAELDRRTRLERRGPFDEYVRGILTARDMPERRTDERRLADNQAVSTWVERFNAERNKP
jgi:anti-sigma-K factor RskA